MKAHGSVSRKTLALTLFVRLWFEYIAVTVFVRL